MRLPDSWVVRWTKRDRRLPGRRALLYLFARPSQVRYSYSVLQPTAVANRLNNQF